MKPLLGIVLAAALCYPPAGAAQNVGSARTGERDDHHITLRSVQGTVTAVNYRARSGSTRLDFSGTALMPDAEGIVEVQNKGGYTEIELMVDDLKPAREFGPEYLTYVLWAITPEGRPSNLGELVLDGNDGDLDVTTQLQAFGLVLTAEPYFAVTQPSDVIVMENVIRRDTSGDVQEVDAKFALLPRGLYASSALPADLKPLREDNTPSYLLQARNAVRIATWSGAEQNAAEVIGKARSLLVEAETLNERRQNKKDIETAARQAVQVAEDARLMALQKSEELRLAEERRAAAAREALAQSEAELNARRRAEAETQQKLEAERRARAEAEERAARLQADNERAQAARATADAAQAREQAERARLEAEATRNQALAAQQSAEAQKQAALLEADRARVEAERVRNEAARASDEARLAKERADAQAADARNALAEANRDRAQLRARLVEQLNVIMDTRDTARGLIVNMSDVIFDTAQHSLKPGAREKLARISGILAAHPGLTLEVEGHTDSVGGEDYNRDLSERRAGAVKDYLVQQGIPAASISAKGFGEEKPVATNDTPEGRQRNRRVELVVSGEIIGTTGNTSRLTP